MYLEFTASRGRVKGNKKPGIAGFFITRRMQAGGMRPGPVLRVDGDAIATVIDFTGQTFEDTPGSERGVLGIAFAAAAISAAICS